MTDRPAQSLKALTLPMPSRLEFFRHSSHVYSRQHGVLNRGFMLPASLTLLAHLQLMHHSNAAVTLEADQPLLPGLPCRTTWRAALSLSR